LPSFRILLDECIDRRLASGISGHQVKTAPEMGWAGLDNGELLSKAEKAFDVFITVDRNLTFQQNITRFNIAVLVLHSRSNRLEDLMPLISKILDALSNPQKGRAVSIHG